MAKVCCNLCFGLHLFFNLSFLMKDQMNSSGFSTNSRPNNRKPRKDCLYWFDHFVVPRKKINEHSHKSKSPPVALEILEPLSKDFVNIRKSLRVIERKRKRRISSLRGIFFNTHKQHITIWTLELICE